MLIENGDILVLGGLIDDQQTDSEQAVPILGSIPILGALFRSKTTSKDKRNLMLFIRPVILRDSRAASYYTRQKYDFIRDKQLEQLKKDNYFNQGERPTLPSMNDLSGSTQSNTTSAP